jgi:hypothetical protein
MLIIDDTLSLPRDVRLEAGALVDHVRGERYAVNETGALVIGLAGQPLSKAADAVARRFGLGVEHARADVLGFAWVLNRALLANIENHWRWPRGLALWLQLALRLLPAGVLPPLQRTRYPLDTTTVARAAVTAMRAASKRALTFGAVTALALLHLGALAGELRSVAVPSLGLGCMVGLGLVLHEGLHAVALRGVPAALITNGLRTYVLHPRVAARRATLVGLTGPAGPTLAGVVGAGVATAMTSPSLAVLLCPLGAHALSLTVVGRDGRAACGL